LLRHLTEVLVAWGPAGILLLSILDSSGVPVAGVFDALLILIAVKNPPMAWICAAMAVIGSTVGSMILFSAARNGSGRFSKKPEPGSRSAKFRRWFRTYGLVTVFVPALMPIPMPLKLFVISAGVLGTSWKQFISVLLAARILRYFGEAWLGVQLGSESTTFLKTHALHFGLGAIVIAVLLAGFIRLRGGQPEHEAEMV
jgi:membrane protein YqaA with SNARE-associated domain